MCRDVYVKPPVCSAPTWFWPDSMILQTYISANTFSFLTDTRKWWDWTSRFWGLCYTKPVPHRTWSLQGPTVVPRRWHRCPYSAQNKSHCHTNCSWIKVSVEFVFTIVCPGTYCMYTDIAPILLQKLNLVLLKLFFFTWLLFYTTPYSRVSIRPGICGCAALYVGSPAPWRDTLSLSLSLHSDLDPIVKDCVQRYTSDYTVVTRR